MYYDLKSRY
jgi:hypothetical protein